MADPGRSSDDRTPRPPRPEVDVAVVGAGYCGGRRAPDPGPGRTRSVVVIDRDPIGTGASTRNGGMVIPELKAGPASCSRSTARSGGACTTTSTRPSTTSSPSSPTSGSTATTPAPDSSTWPTPAPTSPGSRRWWPSTPGSSASRCTGVPRRARGDEIGSTAFFGGVVLERTGGLHPARFHAGWPAWPWLREPTCTTAPPRSASTRATGARRDGAGFELATERGTVVAGTCIVATNAYADGLVPWLRRRVVPSARTSSPPTCSSRGGAIGQPPRSHARRHQERSSTGASPPTAGSSSAVGARLAPATVPEQPTSSTRHGAAPPAARRCRHRARVGRQRRDHPRPHAPRRPGPPRVGGGGLVRRRLQRVGASALNTWLGARLAAVARRRRAPAGVRRPPVFRRCRLTRSARPTSRSSVSGTGSRTDVPEPHQIRAWPSTGATRARLAG